MKEQLMQKIEALTNRAKASKEVLKNAEKRSENSLADNIKTKQQAEHFKRLLKAL